jgi:hypothetical protein
MDSIGHPMRHRRNVPWELGCLYHRMVARVHGPCRPSTMYPLGTSVVPMGHYKCQSPIQWATIHCPWSCFALSHGYVTIVHGTLPMLHLHPMGSFPCPWPTLHLSHEYIKMVPLCTSVKRLPQHCCISTWYLHELIKKLP